MKEKQFDTGIIHASKIEDDLAELFNDDVEIISIKEIEREKNYSSSSESSSSTDDKKISSASTDDKKIMNKSEKQLNLLKKDEPINLPVQKKIKPVNENMSVSNIFKSVTSIFNCSDKPKMKNSAPVKIKAKKTDSSEKSDYGEKVGKLIAHFEALNKK